MSMWPRFKRAGWVAIPLAVAIAAIALTARHRHEWRLRRAIGQLPSRLIEGRLTGAPYAPYVKTTRRDLQILRARAAAAEALNTTRRGTAHDLVVAHLLLGDDESAIRLVESGGGNPADLAALLHAQATQADDVMLLTKALAAADASVERHDAHRPAALFNRGLVLAVLGLRGQAALAFHAAAAAEPDPDWRLEASERANELSAATRAEAWRVLQSRLETDPAGHARTAVRNFPQQARTWAETDYLGRWGDCIQRGEDCAARWLAVAREIGRALASRTGDHLLIDAVLAIEQNPQNITTLAFAHTTYRDARKLHSDRKAADATEGYRKSEDLFRAGGSPMHLSAACLRGDVMADQAQYDDALAVLDTVDAPVRYAALQAQVDWAKGRALARMGRIHEAVDATRRAATLFTRLGETDNATRMHVSLASGLTLLGRYADAWRARRDVFVAASAGGDGGVLELALNSAGRAAIREKRWDVALSFFGLQAGLEKTTPRYRFDAILWSAFCAAKLPGRRHKPFAEVHAAASAIPDRALRAEAVDEARFAEAVLIGDDDPAASIQLLNQVVAFRSATGRDLRIEQVFAERARALWQLGQRDAASSDFTRATSVLETQRKGIAADDLRDAFFGTAADVFADHAYLLGEIGAFQEAFEVIDRANARIILDRLDNTEPLPAGDAVARIPRDQTVVQYASGTRGTVIAFASAGMVAGSLVPVRNADLVRLAAKHAAAIKANDRPTMDEMGARLHSLLIEPALRVFPRTRLLAIVTDEATAGIVFAALRNPRTGRFLIEEMAILITPSVTTHIRMATKPPASREHLVAIADPAFDGILFPDLPRLTHAEEEARAVRGLYRSGIVLAGTDAALDDVRAEMKRADVIHLAAHAIVNPAEHSRSVIPFAPGSDDRGVLYAADIVRLKLERSPIVVLAACHSAASTPEPGSIRSLALSFIAAGSRNVVGARWAIDDADTREFSTALHRHLATHPPADAVQRAQLDLLRHKEPRQWAAFQSFGF
jgi:CHAT domain-containing protein/tetratricopeptide (TPR) repeat protein